MKIDQEVAVGSILVLTDAPFDYRRVFQSGQTPFQTLTHLGESLVGHNSIAGVRIKFGSVTINRDLNAAPFGVRQAISLAFKVDPSGQSGCRKTSVACRSSEIENFLACGMNSIS